MKLPIILPLVGKLVDPRKNVHNFRSRVAQNGGIGHAQGFIEYHKYWILNETAHYSSSGGKTGTS